MRCSTIGANSPEGVDQDDAQREIPAEPVETDEAPSVDLRLVQPVPRRRLGRLRFARHARASPVYASQLLR